MRFFFQPETMPDGKADFQLMTEYQIHEEDSSALPATILKHLTSESTAFINSIPQLLCGSVNQ